MKTVTASDANREFSKLLRDVSRGETVTVLSRGRPVATILPAKPDRGLQQAARRRLLERLQRQSATGKRDWSRGELYERGS